jgi:hypothetical protein
MARAEHVSQAGVITFKTSIIKGGIEKFALKQPIFLVGILLLQVGLALTPPKPSPIDPLYSSKVSFGAPPYQAKNSSRRMHSGYFRRH